MQSPQQSDNGTNPVLLSFSSATCLNLQHGKTQLENRNKTILYKEAKYQVGPTKPTHKYICIFIIYS